MRSRFIRSGFIRSSLNSSGCICGRFSRGVLGSYIADGWCAFFALRIQRGHRWRWSFCAWLNLGSLLRGDGVGRGPNTARPMRPDPLLRPRPRPVTRKRLQQRTRPFAAPAALEPSRGAAMPASMAFHNASSWPGLPGSAWRANRPFSMSSQDFMFSFLSFRRSPLPWAQTAAEPIFSPSPNAAGTAPAIWSTFHQSPHG